MKMPLKGVKICIPFIFSFKEASASKLRLFLCWKSNDWPVRQAYVEEELPSRELGPIDWVETETCRASGSHSGGWAVTGWVGRVQRREVDHWSSPGPKQTHENERNSPHSRTTEPWYGPTVGHHEGSRPVLRGPQLASPGRSELRFNGISRDPASFSQCLKVLHLSSHISVLPILSVPAWLTPSLDCSVQRPLVTGPFIALSTFVCFSNSMLHHEDVENSFSMLSPRQASVAAPPPLASQSPLSGRPHRHPFEIEEVVLGDHGPWTCCDWHCMLFSACEWVPSPLTFLPSCTVAVPTPRTRR